MSEYELIELGLLANEAGNTALALYLTTVSGYLVAAYFVGSSLSRYQVSLVNSLFLFFSSAFTYSAVSSYSAMRLFQERVKEAKGSLESISGTAESVYVVVIGVSLITGIIGALKFMWDIRGPGRDA